MTKEEKIKSAYKLVNQIDQLHIIGAGGIGSHFCWLLDNFITNSRFSSNLIHPNVTVYDFDTVGKSNIAHQDFYTSEFFMPKALLMGARYSFNYKVMKYGIEELDIASSKGTKNSVIVCICADNSKIRKDVYNYVKNAKKYDTLGFIDMRAYQDLAVLYTHFIAKTELMNSLGQNPDDPAGLSCQAVEDSASSITKLGNFDAPLLGLQTLLRWYNKEDTLTKYIGSVL